MEKPILVISAMEDVELEYLKAKLKNVKIEKNKVCTFYEGEMIGKSVVLCSSDVGIINSASSITLGIEKYAPKAIINQGTAGGYGDDVHKGDIVVGTEIINITSLESKSKKKGEGTNLEDYELTTFIYGEKNHLITQKASEELIQKLKNIKRKNIHFGIIGSRRCME